MRGRKTYEPAAENEVEKYLCSIEELSEVLKVGGRQIRNYVRDGMPRRSDRRFYLPAAIRWHTLYFADLEQQDEDRPELEDLEDNGDLLEWPSDPGASTEEMMHEFERETAQMINQLLQDTSGLGH